MTMDVHLNVANDFVLRSNDLTVPGAPIGLGAVNITIGGDLRLVKTAGRDVVRLLGSVNTVRGTYDFQGRRFAVLRDGTIRFEGGRDINPDLMVSAQRAIQGVLANVNIRGTMKKPELELSSVPPLEQSEILSLIVFNQPINQLGEGEQVALTQRAQQLAAGALASTLTNSLGKALNLTEFSIQSRQRRRHRRADHRRPAAERQPLRQAGTGIRRRQHHELHPRIRVREVAAAAHQLAPGVERAAAAVSEDAGQRRRSAVHVYALRDPVGIKGLADLLKRSAAEPRRQPRQPQEDLGGDERVAGGRVAIVGHDAEHLAERVQREVANGGPAGEGPVTFEVEGEVHRIEAAVQQRQIPMTAAGRIHGRDVVADVVPDDDPVLQVVEKTLKRGRLVQPVDGLVACHAVHGHRGRVLGNLEQG